MATIRVPAPSPGSFNKHAPINHLLETQISHFREVEKRFPRAQQSDVRIGDIATESDAARYIGYVTAVLHGMHPPKPVLSPRPSAVVTLPAPPQTGLAIAAATEAAAPRPSKPKHARKAVDKQVKKTAKKQAKKVAKKQTNKTAKKRGRKQS